MPSFRCKALALRLSPGLLSPGATCNTTPALQGQQQGLYLCLSEHPRRAAPDIGLNTFVYFSLTFALLKGQCSAVEMRTVFLIITYYSELPFLAPELPAIPAAACGTV